MIKPKNLLIVRTDRIGDVVLSIPMAQAVKKHFPKCRITFLVRNYTKELLEKNSYLDEVIILKENGNKIPILSNAKEIKKKNFDSCIIVNPTFSSALMLFLAGIKNRIGTGYRAYSFLFNHKIYEHRKYAEKHELEFNLSLLKVFGIHEKPSPGKINFDLYVEESSINSIKNILFKEGISFDKPIIIFHPGSGGSAVDYPMEKFRDLLKLTLEKINADIIITGSKKEYELCQFVKGESRAINFAGKLNLKELISLISLSYIFISNSTGPIHIAAALNKYTIGFYPNTLPCSPKRWGPYSSKAKVFTPNGDCEKCKMEQCSSLECMSTIEVTTVFAEIEKICSFFAT